jgi:hypothetical protein
MRYLTLASGLLMIAAALPGAFELPLWFLFGFGVTYGINRWVHPLCPACASDHNHMECGVRLHGLGLPLFLAFSLHAFADGLNLAEPGVILHKLPECAAMFILFESALGSRLSAILLTAGVQAFTVIGYRFPPTPWASQLEVTGKGSLLFLGVHSLHSIGVQIWRYRNASHPSVAAATTTPRGNIRPRPL